MVHVLERAECRRPQVEDRGAVGDIADHFVQHLLPGRQRSVVKSLDNVTEGDVEDVVVVVRMAIAEYGGKGVAPISQGPAIGCGSDGGGPMFADDHPRIYLSRNRERIEENVGASEVRLDEADLARIVTILRHALYSGYVVLEYEAEEDPLTAIPRYARQLRDLL